MQIEEKTILGVKYLSTECLVFGDYGGAGSVGKANIEELKEKYKNNVRETSYREFEREEITDFSVDNPPQLIVCYGAYSSEQAFLLDNDETKEIMEDLDNYPLLNDERMSEIEMQWEDEAWESWVKSDLLRSIEDEDLQEFATGLSNDTLFELYRKAMEDENEYPIPEYNGSYIHIERISDSFTSYIEKIKERYDAGLFTQEELEALGQMRLF